VFSPGRVGVFPRSPFRFIQTEPPFSFGQNSVLFRPRFRFFKADMAFCKSLCFSWQDGNRITYGSILPKGRTPSGLPERSALRFSHSTEAKSMKSKIPGGRYAANHLLTLRVTPEEKNWLAERVAIIGISLSAYVRNRIFGGRPILPRADEAAIRELRRMGGLIKHNFETLRQAKMGAAFIRRHEDLLQAIVEKIEELGSRQNDCEEDQESEYVKTENKTDR
jgi:hypothetical protein